MHDPTHTKPSDVCRVLVRHHYDSTPPTPSYFAFHSGQDHTIVTTCLLTKARPTWPDFGTAFDTEDTVEPCDTVVKESRAV